MTDLKYTQLSLAEQTLIEESLVAVGEWKSERNNLFLEKLMQRAICINILLKEADYLREILADRDSSALERSERD